MSRYIDIEPILEWCDNPEVFEPYGVNSVELEKKIRQAPSIDIVRCSECVYCNVQNTKYLYAICERHSIEFKPFEDDTRTHGCAWGKQTERSRR